MREQHWNVYYQVWNRSPVKVQCMKQGTQSQYTGTTQRNGIGRNTGGGLGMGNTCTPVADACQFRSVAQSCLTPCEPMNRSTPGFHVHHQLLEFTQTHVHWVGDAIQPSHPLSSPSPPALNLSQHQGLFQWVSYSPQLAKVLAVSASASACPMNTQDWSPLGWTGQISLQSKRLARVFSNTAVQKHQFFSSQIYSPTLTSIHDYWKNHSLD